MEKEPDWCECEEYGQHVAVPCGPGRCPTLRARLEVERARKALVGVQFETVIGASPEELDKYAKDHPAELAIASHEGRDADRQPLNLEQFMFLKRAAVQNRRGP